MSWIAIILILISCIGMCWQDIKTRTIGWWWIPVFTTGIVIQGITSLPLQQLIYYALINLLILGIIILCLIIYQWIKSGKISNIVDQSIGLGDLLLFVALCFAFSPVNFVAFLLLGFIISLCLHLLISSIVKLNHPQVPLAGYLASFFLVISLLQFPMEFMNQYDDMYFLHLII